MENIIDQLSVALANTGLDDSTYLLILGHLTNYHRIRSTICKFVCTILQMLLQNVP
jgi:hypothetical protein